MKICRPPLFFSLLCLFTLNVLANTDVELSDKIADKRYANYCIGDRVSPAIPVPNLNNKDIQAAARKLNQVWYYKSFWMYGDMQSTYKLCDRGCPKELAFNRKTQEVFNLDKFLKDNPSLRYEENSKTGKQKKKSTYQLEKDLGIVIVKQNTYNFLTILCGEYRDHVKRLEARLNWVKGMNVMRESEQDWNPEENVWQQMTSEGYQGVMNLSSDLFNYRLEELGPDGAAYLEVGQKSIKPFSDCELRFMVEKMIVEKKQQHIHDYALYKSELAAYEKTCSEEQLNTYYEFRGDGNFRPQSVESNGNMWNARIFSKNCKSTRDGSKKISKGGVITDQDCNDYFSQPYTTRYRLNKEGMLKLFFYPRANDAQLRDYDYTWVFVTEDLNGDDVAEFVILNDLGDGANLVQEIRTRMGQLKKSRQEWYGQIIHHMVLNKAMEMLSEKNKEQLVPVLFASNEIMLAKQEEVAKALNNLDGYQKQIEDLEERMELLSDKIWDASPTEQEKLEAEYEKANEKVDDLNIKLDDFTYADQLFAQLNNGVPTEGIDLVLDLEGEIQHHRKDFGFFDLFTNDEGELNLDAVWDRLAIIFDRHTDWYHIDMLNIKTGVFQPTFSPWVASSYYIHKSYPFTIPGYAMGESDLKAGMQWMFVQKIQSKDWFNAEKLSNLYDEANSSAENAKLVSNFTKDFDLLNTWFDEMTFSRSSLGAAETGWDRFASPESSEMGHILYLKNIDHFTVSH